MMNSFTSLFLLGCLFVVYVHAKKPTYCRKYDCPEFAVKSSGGGFEVRTFEETTWLSTSVKSKTAWPSKDQQRSMFFKLFPYFMPKNRRARRIPMAVPALFKIQKNGASDYEISMMFYVTAKNPPAPKNSATTLVTRPKMDVYVREFTQVQWPEDAEFDNHVAILESAITDKSSFDSGVYYRASYNYPFDRRDKHHEVWYDVV